MRARARPRRDRPRQRTISSRSVGTPSALSGSGTSPRSVQIRASRAPGSSSSSPSSRHRSTAHGLRATNESGPLSSSQIADRRGPQPAADDGLGLQHGDVERGIGLEQPMGRGQARDTAAHDHDPFAWPHAGPRAARGRRRRATRTNAGSAFGISVRTRRIPASFGDRLRLDVEVVQDLEVVGDEPGRAHHRRRAALRREVGEDLLDRRAPPGVVGAAGALPRDLVPRQAELGRDPVRGLGQAVAVPARLLARVAAQASQRPVLDRSGWEGCAPRRPPSPPGARRRRARSSASATRAARNETKPGSSWYERTNSNAGGPSPACSRTRST